MSAQIYLHSTTREFADTQRLSEAAFLGRPLRQDGPLSVLRCGCGTRGLVRIRRTRWMRLFPAMRHYLCRLCGARVLRLRLRERVGYGAVYIAPVPLTAIRERLLNTWPAIWAGFQARGQSEPPRGRSDSSVSRATSA